MTGGLPTEGGYKRVSQNTSVTKHLFAGSTSGTTTLQASAVAGGTVSLPAVTDTLAVLGTAQTFSAVQTFSAGYLDAVSTPSTSAIGSNGGTVILSTTAAGSTSFVLPAPVAGANKYLYSVGNATVTSSGATIGEATSSLIHINFTAANQTAHLHGLSTAKWAFVSQNSTAITVST